MDRQQYVVIESFKSKNEEEIGNFIQVKIDQYIRNKLENN